MTSALPVRMLMMEVWEVGMGMEHRRVPMPVRVRLAFRIAWRMLVLMVLIVHVRMFVLHRLVTVQMGVALDEMQIEAHAHQHGCAKQLRRYRFVEQRDA